MDPDCLITLGIKPDNPSVHYGYIHRGIEKEKVGNTPFYLVNEFKEKPDKSTAQKISGFRRLLLEQWYICVVSHDNTWLYQEVYAPIIIRVVKN